MAGAKKRYLFVTTARGVDYIVTIDSCYTNRQQERYFMSAEDQQAKERAPLDYMVARKKYAFLRHEAETVAKGLEALARILRDRPETITFGGDDAALKNYLGLGALVDDIQKTGEELRRLTDLMEQLGCPDPLTETS
jgi:hypothetical protein